MERDFPRAGLKPGAEPGETTFARFYDVCARFPQRPALVFLDATTTFAELRDWVDRFATALHRLGVGKGDRVVVYLGNLPQWVVANLAAQRIGAVAVPVSPIYTAHELATICRDAEARTVVCQDTNVGAVRQVTASFPLDHVIVASLTELLPEDKRKEARELDRFAGGEVDGELDFHRFAELLAATPAQPPTVEIDLWRDLATLMYTGGTAAEPNGVPGTHMMEVSYVRDVQRDVLAGHVREGDDVLVMPSPLFHIMARGFFMAAGLNSGSTTVLLPVPYVETVLKAVETYGARWILGVPAMYRMVLDSDKVDDYRLESLRYCYCGGDVLSPSDLARWHERTGVALFQVYGSTDVGHVCYGALDDAESDPTVVGRPLATYRCRVVRPDDLSPLPPGRPGELLVTADCNVKGYWRRPEQTATRWVELDDGVYFRTGDTVEQLLDGRIRFIERSADTIKYKAYRISPHEVEAVLRAHEDVADAAAVGIRDEEVGERILALVVPRPEVDPLNLRRVKKWCKQRLAPYKVPHLLEQRDSVPRDAEGRLTRQELRAEERRRHEP